MSFGRPEGTKKAHIVFLNGDTKVFDFKLYNVQGEHMYFYDCMNYPGEECTIIINTRNIVSVTITNEKKD